MKRHQSFLKIMPQANDTLSVLYMALGVNFYCAWAWYMALKQVQSGQWINGLPFCVIGSYGLYFLYCALVSIKQQEAMGRPELHLQRAAVHSQTWFQGTISLNRSVLNLKRSTHAPFKASVQLNWYRMTTGSGDHSRAIRWQSPLVTQLVPRDLMNMTVGTDLPSPAWLARQSKVNDRGAWELVLCVGEDQLLFDVTAFANGECRH